MLPEEILFILLLKEFQVHNLQCKLNLSGLQIILKNLNNKIIQRKKSLQTSQTLLVKIKKLL